MSRVIAFLSDFGLDDTYVGQVKGVLAGRAPDAQVIDVTHAVEPYAVDHGAWLLEVALGALPEDAVVLAVVDPGVGTERAGLVVQSGRRHFVGPDNGVLSPALPADAREQARDGGRATVDTAWRIERTDLQRTHVAATFHGRDVFAPVAAFMAQGGAAEEVGPPAASIVALPPFGPDAEGRAAIAHVDRYGNLITTVPAGGLPAGACLATGGRRIERWVRTFGDAAPGELVAHRDSSGFVAIAMNQGNAADALGVRRGDAVRVVAR